MELELELELGMVEHILFELELAAIEWELVIDVLVDRIVVAKQQQQFVLKNSQRKELKQFSISWIHYSFRKDSNGLRGQGAEPGFDSTEIN